MDDVNNMCQSFVDRVFEVEDLVGRFDIIHAHDWLTANAMIWIKQGRGDCRVVLTMHSTEFGRSGNNFWAGESARIRDHERHGTYCADRVIAVSGALKGELMWMYNLPDWKCWMIYNGVPVRFGFTYGAAPQDADISRTAFTFGLGGIALFPMRIGASSILIERTTPADLIAAIEKYKTTVCFTAPTAYRAMIPLLAQGEALYNTRSGQLDLACRHCHVDAVADRDRPKTRIGMLTEKSHHSAL